MNNNILRPANRFQLPDQLGLLHQYDIGVTDYQLRWIARRCQVNLTVAATLAVIAGISNREGR